MYRIAFFTGICGACLCVVAAMLAFDNYMTDDRKDSVRGEINASLDAQAARYDDPRTRRCLRRYCEGQLAHMVTTLRDGLFLSRPFTPDSALPLPPSGWESVPYDRAVMAEIFGAPLRETALSTTTTNGLFKKMDNWGGGNRMAAVQLYRPGQNAPIYTPGETAPITLALAIDRGGIRYAKTAIPAPRVQRGAEVVAHLHGLPVWQFRQTSFEPSVGGMVKVDYRHYLIDLDGMVTLTAISRADPAQVMALLQTLDLPFFVSQLPRAPQGYDSALPGLVPVVDG